MSSIESLLKNDPESSLKTEDAAVPAKESVAASGDPPSSSSTAPVTTATTADAAPSDVLKNKCLDLQNKIRDVESNSSLLSLAIARSTRTVKRLRTEYLVLLEALERKTQLEEEEPKLEESLEVPLNDINALLNGALSSLKAKSSNNGHGSGKRGHPGQAANGNGALAKKAVKKIKDPNYPKRPTNAYLLYCEGEKERVKSLPADEQAKIPDLSKHLTEGWKALDEEARKPFYRVYEQEKERFAKELEEYEAKKSSELIKGADAETPTADNGEGSMAPSTEADSLNAANHSSPPASEAAKSADTADITNTADTPDVDDEDVDVEADETSLENRQVKRIKLEENAAIRSPSTAPGTASTTATASPIQSPTPVPTAATDEEIEDDEDDEEDDDEDEGEVEDDDEEEEDDDDVDDDDDLENSIAPSSPPVASSMPPSSSADIPDESLTGSQADIDLNS